MANDLTEEPPMDDLEKDLMCEMQDDARLNSGSLAPTGDTDLDFINMTGLVAPVMTGARASAGGGLKSDYRHSNLDPEAPVSFYEEGVDDVDTSMDPANTSVLDDEEILGHTPSAESSRPVSSSLAGLQEIITELTEDDNAVPLDSPASRPEQGDAQEERGMPDDLVEIDVAPLESNSSSTAEVEDLANINLEAASAALEDLDMSGEAAGADSAAISGLIASIDFEETASLLEELESQAGEEPKPVEYIEALETPEIEVFMEAETATSASEALEPEAPGRRERVSIATVGPGSISREDPGEVDASVYSKAPLPKTASRHRRRRSFGANVLRFAIALLFMSGAIGFLYYTLEKINTQNRTPEAYYADGIAMINDGLYAKAAEQFTNFTYLYVNDPLRSDAEFMAGYALQLTPAEPRSAAMLAYNDALVKFESFVKLNPMHEKTGRAETLIGIVRYRIGDYDKAVEILSDPKLRLRDSRGYLPALRILARAYAAQSDIENARDALMRAAALEENIAPDKDYMEVASMYSELSRNAREGVMRMHYMRQAIEFWEKSIRMPGILSVKKRELEVLVDYTKAELANVELGAGIKATPETRVEHGAPAESNGGLNLDSLRLPDSAR